MYKNSRHILILLLHYLVKCTSHLIQFDNSVCRLEEDIFNKFCDNVNNMLLIRITTAIRYGSIAVVILSVRLSVCPSVTRVLVFYM